MAQSHNSAADLFCPAPMDAALNAKIVMMMSFRRFIFKMEDLSHNDAIAASSTSKWMRVSFVGAQRDLDRAFRRVEDAREAAGNYEAR